MLNPIFRLAFVLLLFLAIPSFGQQILEQKYAVNEKTPLLHFLDSVEQSRGLRFFYLEEWLKPFSVEKTQEATLNEILANTLQGSDIGFVSFRNYSVIFFKDPSRDIKRENTIAQALKSRKSIEEMTVGSMERYTPGKKLLLKVKVVDENTFEPIIGTTVFIEELKINLITNEKGEYELSLPGGQYLLTHTSVNYEEKIVHLTLFENANLTVVLQDEANILQEVVISDQSIVNRRIGQTVLNMSELRKSPSFLGEADLIKQIQLKSGVTTTSEASSGFNVRGGGVDQNLILYDGTPIFNTSHALGFFNAFNAEAVRSATFYKGGIPAEYGGRTSSVLSIISKEGDFHKWHGKVGIGLVTSDLAIGGPIKRDTSSLIVSFRSSYSDWMLNLLKTRYKAISDGSIRFYDGSVKYAHKINHRNKVSFSAYASEDQFSLASDTVNQWQNIALSLNFDRTVNDNLFMTAGLSFGHYSYNVQESDPPTAFDLRYQITYPALKIDFNHNGTFHKQSFGFHTTYYNFMPGRLEPTSAESSFNLTVMPKEQAVESALYFSDNYAVTDKLQLEGGLRLSIYNRLGPGTVYHYESGNPLDPRNTVDSTVYRSGTLIKTYFRPEPRFSLNYVVGLHSSLKVGYNRMFQYVHLISNSATVTPVDIWQLSNMYFKPQRADQFSAGYFHTSKNNMYETVVEAFYKLQENVLEFKDGANLIMNSQLETDLLMGKGISYGIELTVNKLRGRIKGGLAYTFSRSLRKVNGAYDSEKINNGSWYPSNADQPHVLNLNWNFNITRRIFFTGNFLYHTGRPVSLASSGYLVDGIPVSNFDERNNYRVPDYHRLDVAFVIEGSNKKDRRVESSWVFSLYNAYGRKNPYSVFFVNKGGGILKPYQLSLIGTAVPSISYNIKF